MAVRSLAQALGIFRRKYPFSYIFKYLSPKDFAAAFGGEADQTLAFILSFSRDKNYVKKVLKIIGSEDTAGVVSRYLRNVSGEGADPEFVSGIERHLVASTRRWRDLSSQKRLRKNIFIRGEKHAGNPGEDRAKETGKDREYRIFPESLFRYINPRRRKHTVKIQYKNETAELVNVRGKKLKPGDSIVSQVFIKQFEDFVKKGILAVYIDGAKIGFDEIPEAEKRIADEIPDGTPVNGNGPEVKTGEVAGPEKTGGAPETFSGSGEETSEEKTEETGEEEPVGEVAGAPLETPAEISGNTDPAVEDKDPAESEPGNIAADTESGAGESQDAEPEAPVAGADTGESAASQA
jgi:hypothetical protein